MLKVYTSDRFLCFSIPAFPYMQHINQQNELNKVQEEKHHKTRFMLRQQNASSLSLLTTMFTL